jgi:hypothetical protein
VDRLTAHHLEIMRRSLACGGLPPEQVGWILAEAGRLLDERDRARSVLDGLRRPMSELRGGLNELHIMYEEMEPPERPPGRNRGRTMSSEPVHISS